MTDTTPPTSPLPIDALRPSVEATGLSTPYNVVPLYTVVCYDDPAYPEYHGFCFEGRNNVTNRERRELRSGNQKIIEYSRWWVQPDTKTGSVHPEFGEYDENDLPLLRQGRLIAPYIRAWNAQGFTEDGETAPLPPPSKMPEALEFVETPLMEWVINLMTTALIQGKGLKASVAALGVLRGATSSGRTEDQS